jgi:hypothetical protein
MLIKDKGISNYNDKCVIQNGILYMPIFYYEVCNYCETYQF